MKNFTHRRDQEGYEAYFERLLNSPQGRKAYYESSAWQMRKQALELRSHGQCERCKRNRYQVAHHLTYLHFGAEYLSELQAICKPCHDYLHGISDYDPANVPHRKRQLLLFE